MPRILDAVRAEATLGESVARCGPSSASTSHRRRSDWGVVGSVKRWFKDNPRTVFLVAVGVVLLGLFLGVITPLFATSGPAMADISGVIPATAPAGKRLEVDVSIDTSVTRS